MCQRSQHAFKGPFYYLMDTRGEVTVKKDNVEPVILIIGIYSIYRDHKGVGPAERQKWTAVQFKEKKNNTEPLFNTILDRFCHNLLRKGPLSLQLIMQTTILVTTTATVLISVDYDWSSCTSSHWTVFTCSQTNHVFAKSLPCNSHSPTIQC